VACPQAWSSSVSQTVNVVTVAIYSYSHYSLRGRIKIN
jgi:hypothetical protein